MQVTIGCQTTAVVMFGAGMLMPAWVMAQQVSSQTHEVLETITVTAQRREQSIQEVPIAVTAFGDETLEAMQVVNAAGLQFVVPNFSYTATNFGGVNYTIRGIGASVLGDGADTGVALHYNGAFLQGGGNTSLYYDVEAVEVLRGPQGTLFGRNATGGAVNLRTRRPSQHSEGKLEVAVGDPEERSAEGMLNVPLGNRAAMRLAFMTVYRDGDVKNLTTGNWINGDDAYSGRFSLRWQPLEHTTIDIGATYLHASGDGMQAEKRRCHRDPIGNLGCLPDRLATGLPNDLATLPGLIASSLGLSAPGVDLFADSVNPADSRKIALDFDPRVNTDEWIATLELDQALGSLTLSSITAFATQDGFYEHDNDFAVASGKFLPLLPLGVPASRPDPENLGSLAGRTQGNFDRPWSFERGEGEGRQWLQELRLASHLNGPMNFLIGGFYLDYVRQENLYEIATAFDAAGMTLAAAPPFLRLQTPVADLRSYALFGESYFSVSDTVRLTGGLRWTRDEKQQVNRNVLLNLPRPFESHELEQEAFTGRAVLEWTPEVSFTDQTLGYVSYSRGYKGGGFNPQGTVEVAPEFEPEYVNAFEVGAKNTLLGAMTLNLAAFYYDYNGFQVSKIVNRSSVNENIDATMWGMELEAAAQLGDHWSIDLSAAHLRTKISAASSTDPRDPTGGHSDLIAVKDTETGANCVATSTELESLLGGIPFGNCEALGLPAGAPVSLSGNELANSPRWTLRLGAQCEAQLGGNLNARARIDYSWRSAFWGRIFNRDPIDRIAGWGILNAQLELGHPKGRWFVRLEGSNLLDKDAVTGMYVTDATAGLATNLFLLPGRRVALALGTRF